MNGTYRQCPKCGHQPAVPMPADGECPACGVVFRKWLAAQAALEAGTPLPKPVSASRRLAADEPSPWQAHLAALLLPLPGTSPATFYGRCAALVYCFLGAAPDHDGLS
jgi:hypothetical protein